MGEAKRRQIARRKEFESLDAAFKDAGIDVSAPGFYDNPVFMKIEKEDPRALELYARWVLDRPRDAGYDARVRDVVPRLTRLVEAKLGTENGVGACVNIATAMVRMLDRLGVWSFAVQGSLTIEVLSRPDVGRRYFPECDLVDAEENVTGHGWLVAPPIIIADPTLKHQRWVELQPAIARLLPEIVATEHGKVVKPRWFDVVSDTLIDRYRVPQSELTSELPYRFKPDLAHIEQFLPARSVRAGGLDLRYVAGAVKVSDVDLEELPSVSFQALNLTPKRIWEEAVCPELSDYRAKQSGQGR